MSSACFLKKRLESTTRSDDEINAKWESLRNSTCRIINLLLPADIGASLQGEVVETGELNLD